MTVLALSKLMLAVVLLTAVVFIAEWEALHLGDRVSRRLASGAVLSAFVLTLLVVLMRPLG